MATLIKRRVGKSESDIDNLPSGLTRAQIRQKTATLPFKFSDELYALYRWRNGVKRENFDCSPFLFRDRCLSNLDEAIETYFTVQETFVTESETKIADWSMCFPFANFEGSYLFLVLGKHILLDKYKHPIINVFEGIDLWFYSFDSMLNTCIEWNQQSFEKYDAPKNEVEIWQKHNPNIFQIDLLHA